MARELQVRAARARIVRVQGYCGNTRSIFLTVYSPPDRNDAASYRNTPIAALAIAPNFTTKQKRPSIGWPFLFGAFGIELPTDRVRVDTRGHLRALACLEDGLLHAGSRPGSSIGWGGAPPLRTSIPIGHTSCMGAVAVTWAHRNRLMQTVYLVTSGSEDYRRHARVQTTVAGLPCR